MHSSAQPAPYLGNNNSQWQFEKGKQKNSPNGKLNDGK